MILLALGITMAMLINVAMVIATGTVDRDR